MPSDSSTLWLALYAIPSEQIFFFLDFDGPGNQLLTSIKIIGCCCHANMASLYNWFEV